jgi:thiamine-phosphate pyrophosphorylase
VTELLAKLDAARLYLVSTASFGGRRLVDLVPELAAAGVDLIQLREKEMEAGQILELGRPLVAACYEAGIPFIVNDRPDVAAALQANGVHLGQDDLPLTLGRRFMPEAIVGRSTHSRSQIDSETTGADRPDYIAVGPVFETPTKPGRGAVGLDLLKYAAPRVGMPWFAIGGIDEGNLSEVMEAGARRVVVVRAITEAPDPVAAAAGIRAILDG